MPLLTEQHRGRCASSQQWKSPIYFSLGTFLKIKKDAEGGWKVSECLGSDANLATISWTEHDHLCWEWLSESRETAISVCPKSPNLFVLEKRVWNLNISRQSLGMTMQHTLRDWMAGWQIQTSDQQSWKKKLPTPRWTEARSSLLWEGEQTDTVEKIFTHFKVGSYTNMTFCFSHTKIHHDYVL